MCVCVCVHVCFGGVGFGGGEGGRGEGGAHAVCVEKKNAARQHHMAKDKEWKPMNKMGTELKEMERQCGKAERRGNETVMVVDRVGFTTGSW